MQFKREYSYAHHSWGIGVSDHHFDIANRLGEAGITLNPFAWYRKHKWLKKYHTQLIFNIESPQKVAALYVVAIAHADGLISLEEKNAILKMFVKEFELTTEDASGLFTSSAFFLKEGTDVVQFSKQIMALTQGQYSAHQIDFTIKCMEKIAALSEANHGRKQSIMTAFRKNATA